MASNQTEHYGLNQWSLTDGVLMDDFNHDNQLVDSALTALDGKIGTSATAVEGRLNTSMTALENRFSTSLSALRSDVTELDTRMDTSLPALEDRFNASLNSVNKNITALDSKTGTSLSALENALNTSFAALEENISALDGDMNTLQTGLNGVQTEVSTLKTTTSTLSGDVTALESKHDTSIAQLSAQIPHVVCGTYEGTGTYGADGPNTLTFTFPPKLVIINQSSGKSASSGTDWFRFIAVQGSSLCYSEYSNNIYSKPLLMHLTWNGNSLSWYGDAVIAQEQGNAADVTYHYVAIG